MEKKKPKLKNQQEKYKEAIGVVLDVCKIKGWRATIDQTDPNSQLATIDIHQYQEHQDVTAKIDLIVQDGVQYSVQPTSFSAHAYSFKSLLTAISTRMQALSWIEKRKQPKEESSKETPVSVSKILRNFDKTARQLKRRHDDRSPYEINDEYDAQDLLHAVLLSYFGDVRPEEYTPSYAGTSSKVDFLLKEERSVIEVKYATAKLKGKEIADQLIIDIKRYQTHPDCNSLFCLVYDPLGNVRNPVGFEKDLSGKNGRIGVVVLIVPH